MASVMCIHFSMQEKNILKHANAKCHLCILQSTCRPLCNLISSIVYDGVELFQTFLNSLFHFSTILTKEIHNNTSDGVSIQINLL